MVRSFAAVICGYIVTGILIFATDQTFAATVPGFNDMPMPPRFYLLISICTDTLYSVLGGWTCAAIANSGLPRGIPRAKNWYNSLFLYGLLGFPLFTIEREYPQF